MSPERCREGMDMVSKKRTESKYDILIGAFPWILASCLAVALLFPGIVSAQKKAGGGVIQLEEITIEGKIQKPNAFYILERQGLGFTIIELKTSFISNIVAPVQKSPF